MSGIDNPISVIKLGGSLLQQPTQLSQLFAELATSDTTPIVVHGGGAAVDTWLSAMGFQIEKRDGLRVSPEQHMPMIVGALSGYANKQLMGYAIAAGLQPVGLSLYELGLRYQSLSSALGQVGVVDPGDSVLSPVVNTLLAQKSLLIVSCIGFDQQGHWYNVNADHAAAELAHLLAADLTFVTDVDAVLDEARQPLAELSATKLHQLIDANVINGGMKVKVEAAMAAAKQLRRSVRICGCACLTRPQTGTVITV